MFSDFHFHCRLLILFLRFWIFIFILCSYLLYKLINHMVFEMGLCVFVEIVILFEFLFRNFDSNECFVQKLLVILSVLLLLSIMQLFCLICSSGYLFVCFNWVFMMFRFGLDVCMSCCKFHA